MHLTKRREKKNMIPSISELHYKAASFLHPTQPDGGDPGEIAAAWLIAFGWGYRKSSILLPPQISARCPWLHRVPGNSLRVTTVCDCDQTNICKRIFSPQMCCQYCQTQAARRSLLDHLQERNTRILRWVSLSETYSHQRRWIGQFMFDVSPEMFNLYHNRPNIQDNKM